MESTNISDGDGEEFTQHALDVHSVTCALCGELADNRKSMSLSDDDYQEFNGYMGEEREVFVPNFPNGEAHRSCFDSEVR